MKKFIVVLMVLFGVAFGQRIDDSGVVRETDDFTGEVTCTQIVSSFVDGSQMGLGYSVSSNGYGLFSLGFYTDDPVYNLFGVMSGDAVLFRFYGDIDEVFGYSVVATDSDVDFPGWQQFVLIELSPEEFEILMMYDDRVRVRLDGSQGTLDFDLPFEWKEAFRAGLLVECLPRSWEGG